MRRRGVRFRISNIKKEVKISSYIAQYPVIMIVQSTLHVTPRQTCSIEHRLGFSRKLPATLQLMRENNSYTDIHHSL